VGLAVQAAGRRRPGAAHAESDPGKMILLTLESPGNPHEAHSQGNEQQHEWEVTWAKYSTVTGPPLTGRDNRQVRSALNSDNGANVKSGGIPSRPWFS
jgi:hypothetical protein